MYLLKQGNLIAYATKTEEEINSVKEYMPYDEIIETSENYILLNGAFVTETEALQAEKSQKHLENTQKAKQAVENGHVTFKNAQFETNAQTVGDLTATMLLMQASGSTEPYIWLSKDDLAVELTVKDFGTLGGLIAEYKNTIWQEKYIAFKNQIEQAETLTELEEIKIEY